MSATGLVKSSHCPAWAQDLLHVAQVGPDHGGRGVIRHQGLSVHGHHRVVVDVDDAGVRVSFLRSLVRVRAGRQPGADIEELADPRIAQECDRADEEVAVTARGIQHLWHKLQASLGHLPVGGEVVLATQHVVIHARRVRDVGADA
jgi:hypothetical protein